MTTKRRRKKRKRAASVLSFSTYWFHCLHKWALDCKDFITHGFGGSTNDKSATLGRLPSQSVLLTSICFTPTLPIFQFPVFFKMVSWVASGPGGKVSRSVGWTIKKWAEDHKPYEDQRKWRGEGVSVLSLSESGSLKWIRSGRKSGGTLTVEDSGRFVTWALTYFHAKSFRDNKNSETAASLGIISKASCIHMAEYEAQQD